MADKVSNPISQAYIDRIIKSKENAKITNKLIRNEDMTNIEDDCFDIDLEVIQYQS